MLFHDKAISITSIYEVHTIVKKKSCFFSLAASKVAKNITLTTRNFLSFIALAFIHCTGVNIVIKTLTFGAINYTLYLQGFFATNRELVSKLTWILEKNL